MRVCCLDSGFAVADKPFLSSFGLFGFNMTSFCAHNPALCIHCVVRPPMCAVERMNSYLHEGASTLLTDVLLVLQLIPCEIFPFRWYMCCQLLNCSGCYILVYAKSIEGHPVHETKMN
jgi:hypothetical protein